MTSVSGAAYSNGELAGFFPLQADAQFDSCDTAMRGTDFATCSARDAAASG